MSCSSLCSSSADGGSSTASPLALRGSILPAMDGSDGAVPTSSASLPVSCDEESSRSSTRVNTLCSGLAEAAPNAFERCATPEQTLASTPGCSDHFDCQIEASRTKVQLKQLQEEVCSEQEMVAFLRVKVAQMNKEKLESASRQNEEVAELMEDNMTLRAELERYEDAQQRHEYDLNKLELQLALVEHENADKDEQHAATLDEFKGLLGEQQKQAEEQRKQAEQQQLELTEEVQRLRRLNAEKDATLEAGSSERRALEVERASLANAVLEQTGTINQLQVVIQQQQGEISQQRESIEQSLRDMQSVKDNERKLLKDLEVAEREIKMVSGLIEAESVAHMESKLGAEILQKKFRDLEAAMNGEIHAKSEAHGKIEILHGQLRDMEEAYASERKQNKQVRDKLEKSEKDLANCQKQLQAELNDKRIISSNLVKQLDVHEKEMAILKAELQKARKKQTFMEESHGATVRDLELLVESFDFNKEAKSVRDISSEPSGASAIIDGLRRLMNSYRNRLEAALEELKKAKKTCESMAKEITSCKEDIRIKDKTLEDCNRQLVEATTELDRLRMESSEMEARIASLKVDVQSLSHDLDKECARNEELNNELTTTIAARKSDEDEHVRYLHGLRQRLTAAGSALSAAAAAGGSSGSSGESGIGSVGAGGSTYDKYSWQDVSTVVLEQLIAVVVELSSTREKVVSIECGSLKREAFIEELQQEHSRLTDRLRASMEMQASHFMRQKEETEEHHKKAVKEIQHQSKKTLKMADDAWGKVRRTAKMQQELEDECADLKARVAIINDHHSALHSAFALLVGAYYPLLARARALATQRAILEEQLRRFEAFKVQAYQLLRALTSDDLTEADGNHRMRNARVASCHPMLRFRVAALAVMAANRLNRMRQHKQHMFYFVDNDNVQSAVCLGSSSPSLHASVLSPRSLKEATSSVDANIVDWLTNKGLLSTVVSCTEEIQDALRNMTQREEKVRPGVLSTAGKNSFKKLTDRLEDFFPDGHAHAEHSGFNARRDKNNLLRQLNRGLQSALSRTNIDHSSCAQSAQTVLSYLQQRVLSFIQRLHACELDKKHIKQELAETQMGGDERLAAYSDRCRMLQAEVDALTRQKEQTVSGAAYENLRREVDGALNRERQAQDLLAEQSHQLRELTDRLGADSAEKLAAERALRASAQGAAGLQSSIQQKEEELKTMTTQLAQVEAERRALHTQVYEAERTLQSAARDKENMAAYLRSVQTALQQRVSVDDFGRVFLSTERLALDSGERGPELVACQRLVTAFVDALQQSNSRITSLQGEVTSHRMHVARLKDELSSVCRRENAGFPGTGSFSRLPLETPPFGSPYTTDFIPLQLPDGSEASYSTISRGESKRNHERKSGSRLREPVLHNGNHRSPPLRTPTLESLY